MKTNAANPYGESVATLRYGRFLRLLGRWRASIYKVVYRDLLIFLVLYYALYCLYFFGLNENGQRYFEAIVVYCKTQNDLAPLTLVLGFYLTTIFSRWWRQYLSAPLPESIAIIVSSLVHGNDNTGRIMRRTVMRYICLALMMVLVRISAPAKKRFGTYQRLIDAGMLMPSERDIFQKWDEKYPGLSKHWMPIVWACSILVRGRNEGRIRDDFALRSLIDSINKFRGQCHLMLQYDVISIPLIYTQVVTMAVYFFFAANLLGRQYGELPVFSELQLYIPIFAIIELVFYLGVLKVAEVLIGPYGDDDQDFDVIWLIERNLQISYIIVDKMYHKHPELLKDAYWDSMSPDELPYPKGSGSKERPFGNFTFFERHPKKNPYSHDDEKTHDNSSMSITSSVGDRYFSVDSIWDSPLGATEDESDGEEEEERDPNDLFEKLRAERERSRQKRRPFTVIPMSLDMSDQTINASSRFVSEGTQADLSQEPLATAAESTIMPTPQESRHGEDARTDDEELMGVMDYTNTKKPR